MTELTLFDVGDATLTPTALALPEDLSFEQWAWYGQRLVRAAASALWWLGDWWAYGEQHYGERKAATVLEGFPYSFQTCMHAGVVARRFETCRRLQVLPWSHHQEVVALRPSVADEFLEAAQINGWSQKELRQQVREWRRRQRARKRLTAEEQRLKASVLAGEIVVATLREDQHAGLINWAEKQDLYVAIDRRSEWGNPFEMPDDGDRATVIANYREHYLPNKPSLLDKIDTLRGKVLGCWCVPEPCHGDVLKAVAER